MSTIDLTALRNASAATARVSEPCVLSPRYSGHRCISHNTMCPLTGLPAHPARVYAETTAITRLRLSITEKSPLILSVSGQTVRCGLSNPAPRETDAPRAIEFSIDDSNGERDA
jgi:hypothetical protein